MKNDYIGHSYTAGVRFEHPVLSKRVQQAYQAPLELSKEITQPASDGHSPHILGPNGGRPETPQRPSVPQTTD